MCVEANGLGQPCAFDEKYKTCVEWAPTCAERTVETCGCRVTTCEGACGWDCNYELCYWDTTTGRCADVAECKQSQSNASCAHLGCSWVRLCAIPIMPPF